MEALQLRSISYLLAVYEEKSFSRAAEKCYISQPALSKMVKKTESILGAVIFDRSSTPLQVTKEGAVFIAYFQKMMEIQNEMKQYSKLLHEQRRGDLNVGAPSFFCTYVLPPIISAFQMENPEFNVKLFEANDNDLRKFLKSGVVNIGISVEEDMPPEFSRIVLRNEQIILAVPACYEVNEKLKAYAMTAEDVTDGKYRDAAIPAVHMGSFAKEKFLFLKNGNDMHRRGLKICRDAGFEPMIKMELDQMITAYYLASVGEGATFIRASIPYYAGGSDELVFYKVDHPETTRQLRVFHSERGQIAEQQRLFLEFLQEYPQPGS